MARLELNSYILIATSFACLFFSGIQSVTAQGWSVPKILSQRSSILLQASLGLSSSGELHVVWEERRNSPPQMDSLYCARIKQHGQPMSVSLIGPDRGTIESPRLVVDADNVPHLMWVENDLNPGTRSLNRLLHAIIGESGLSHSDTLFALDFLNTAHTRLSFDVMISSSGRLYAYWKHWNGKQGIDALWLRSWHKGKWGPAVRHFSGYSCSEPHMAVGTNGSLHIVFVGSSDALLENGRGNASRVWYSVRSETDSVWVKPVAVYYNPRTFPNWPKVAIDANNRRHIMWQEDVNDNYLPDALLYSFSHDGKKWSRAKNLSQLGEVPFYPHIVVDSYGTVHVVWDQAEFAGLGAHRGVYYCYGREDSWSEPMKIFEPQRPVKDLVIDAQDRLHLLMAALDSAQNTANLEYSTRDAIPASVASHGATAEGVPPGGLLVSSYPNPFNSRTIFFLALNQQAKVWVRIYNLCGQVVNTLLHEQALLAKTSLFWDGTNQQGEPLPSGLYFCQVRAETNGTQFEVTRKVLLVRSLLP